MRKTFQIDGYAVNQRGHTVGIHYTMTSTSPDTAISSAQLLAQQGGYKHVRITRVQEVAA
ncbi:TPA: hypothetical protein ACTY1G_003586 [Klebsiella michiganensis]|uniref:hypothetical protein n=1 Tax=Klebsiella variicola TaxID=244366 RepID=UPI001D791334|nr:hypothetical protein AI2637V1_0593 [Klebsiella pneumoniae]HCJ3810783.1 hypothetical protein [Klebsiella pneumoniae]HDT3870220.1 hypothetical protein [Klebsiella pneumoniae subsp. pneumoniae]